MGMNCRLLLLFVATSLALAACSPFTILNGSIDGNGYTVRSGIPYGPGDRKSLDVYVPKQQAGPLPVVVFFYGGSWKRGKRANYRFAADALAGNGYLAVVPDYRVYPEVRFPAFVEDGAKAVRWVLEHAAEFGGDPGQIYLMGHSAGAHIATLLTLDERYLAAEGMAAKRIRGTIALAGPYAFYPSRTRSIAPIFAHLADENAARPIAFVDGDEAPLLLLHGETDRTVRAANTVALSKAVRAAGGRVRHIIYPGVGHIGIVSALAPSFRDVAPVLRDTMEFIDGQGSSSAIGR
jgi:acetyl esterase/lipase